jgi:uncharacterized protein DUF2652/polyketide cyclase/dehydrase/lipid transport protein
MLNRSEPASLVIADISGYTSYLAGTELDHAQDILADLIGTVVSSLRPTFRLAKLEGDAAFVYALTPTIDGSQLQDTIERCYFAFRRRLRDIHQASICDCNACVLVPNLDLKFVAHHGLVARQRMAGRDELVGSAVIVVHRLLKNHVAEALGLAAYALYTDACIAAMGLGDPAGAGLLGHNEQFESVGEIGGWVRDLANAWADEEATARLLVEPEQAMRVWQASFHAPPSVAWEWTTSPVRRPQWQHGVTAVAENVARGRRGAGTVNHCMHGKDAIVEEILDWRPFEHVTQRTQLPDPALPKMTTSYEFEPETDGTRVVIRLLRPRSTKERSIVEKILPMLDEMFESGLAALGPLVEAEMAQRRASGPALEPSLPVPAGRYASEPVVRAGR